MQEAMKQRRVCIGQRKRAEKSICRDKSVRAERTCGRRKRILHSGYEYYGPEAAEMTLEEVHPDNGVLRVRKLPTVS